MTNKLDVFIDAINEKTSKPIKSAYYMTLSSHISEKDTADVKDTVFDEVYYYLLNDFMDGCEFSVKYHDYLNEIELVKDVISICKTSTVIMNMAQSLQNIQIDLRTKLKTINEKEKNHITRFIFLGLSYQDNRYISNLVDQLFLEGFSEDDLIQLVNKRIIDHQSRTATLKI